MTNRETLLTRPEASDQAFTSVIAKTPVNGMHWQLGIATWEVGGYKPTDLYFPSKALADIEAETRNAGMGLTKEQALAIVISSMRVPGGREGHR